MVGTGAVDDPYIVTTAQELYDIRSGGATPGTTSTYYRQGNNIVIPSELSDIWCLGTNAEKTYNFKEYAGNGYKVSGLNFQQPSVDDVGLFPRLPTTSKTIRDLGVDCNLIGGTNVGGICGSSSSSYTTTISNCYATGAVSGSSNVGGICGSSSSNSSSNYRNRAHIRNCFALNQKIIRTDYSSMETFGRVVGILVYTNSLTSNYALDTMLFYPDGE